MEQLQPAPIPRQPEEKPFVYLSYGWSDANFALVERLEQAFAARGWELRFDRKQMRTGDWISNFMFEIGRSPKVLVLLDGKYLGSRYCMQELRYLHQQALGDKAGFLQRIVPCFVEELPVNDALGRDTFVATWIDKHQRYSDLLARRNPLTLAPETLEEAKAISDFYQHTDQMLQWLSDVLMPRLIENIEKDNFQPIFDLLAAQGLAISPQTCGA